MEHDDELNIREKINSLDSTPLAWDKDLVWSSIRFHGTRPSRRLIIYYAAASIILAAAIVFYSVERTQQELLRVRIGEIELAMKQTLVLQPEHSTHARVAEAPCEQPEKVRSERSMVAQQKSHAKAIRSAHVDSKIKAPVSTTIAIIPIEEPVEPEVQTALTTSGSPIVNQPASVNPVTVPVILGKSIVASSGQQDTRKGRFSLRLFGSEDEKPATPATTPIVTLAGINN